jgi:hypothetical protein
MVMRDGVLRGTSLLARLVPQLTGEG